MPLRKTTQRQHAKPSHKTNRHFLSAHWVWWLLGALIGGAAQAAWLQSHGWSQAMVRLPLGIVLGGLILGPLLGWAARHSGGLRQRIKRNAAYLLGLDRKGGRIAWAVALIIVIAAGGVATYWWRVRPLIGAQKVREYFLANAEKDVKGMLTLHFPDLARIKPKEVSVTAEHLDFASKGDFPTQKDYHFVMRWMGVIHAPASGTYGFGGRVDDGLVILINGRTVAADWREAPPREVWGTVALAKGWHAIDILYRQVAGGAMLQVRWQPPGANRELLPPKMIRPLKPDTHLAEIIRLQLAYGMLPRVGSTYPPFLGGRFWRVPWFSLQL